MHPILIDMGFLKIYSYGFSLALAFLVGTFFAYKRAQSYNENPTNVLDLSLYIILSALIGSRLFYVAYFPKHFIEHPLDIIMIQRGGLVFYGGIIFSILTALAFFIKRKLSILKYADIFAPCIPIGQAIGRIGCFLNGCCYGRPTFDNWGVLFPKNSPGGFSNLFNLLLHPTQIYSSLILVSIFIILLLYEKHKKYNSELFLLYAVLYSLTRFITEFFRGDLPKWILGRYTTSQMLSVFILVLSFIGMIIVRNVQLKRQKNG
ncbi:prolipoprotein diacylglyceryl transferase [Chlamydiota bacterium]